LFEQEARTRRQRTREFPNASIARRSIALTSPDDASHPEDMNLPGFRFHALVGRGKGRYAVDASANWRITFGWTEGDAVGVDLEDYH